MVAGEPMKLEIADLLCQPASLSPGGSYWEHNAYYPPISFLNEGYKPIISPPPDILSLDPTWGGCVADLFEGKDPPRALTPAVALAPTTTTESAKTDPTPPSPSSMPSPVPSSTRFTTSVTKAEPIHTVEASHTATSHIPASSLESQPSSELSKDSNSAQTMIPSATAGNSDLQTTLNPTTHQLTNTLATTEPQKPASVDTHRPVTSIASTSDSTYLTEAPNTLLTPGASTTTAASLSTTSNDPSNVMGSQRLGSNSDISTTIVGGVSLAIGGPASLESTVKSIQPPYDPLTSISANSGSAKSIEPGLNSGTTTMTVGGLTLTVGLPAATNIDSVGGTISQSSSPLQVLSTDPSVSVESQTGTSQNAISPFGTSNTRISEAAGRSSTSSHDGGVSASSTTLLTTTPTITVSSRPFSLGVDGIAIGAQTSNAKVSALVTGADHSPMIDPMLGGHSVLSGSGAIFVDGKTLSIGAPALTVSGTPISLGTGRLMIGSQTYAYGSGLPDESTSGSFGSTDHQVITANPTGFSIAGTTLLPGSRGISLSGTVVSLNPSGFLVIGTSTFGATPALVTADSEQSSTDNPGTTTSNAESFTVPVSLTSSGMSTVVTNTVDPPVNGGSGSSGSDGLGKVILSGFGSSNSTPTVSATSTRASKGEQHRLATPGYGSMILLLGATVLCICFA